MYDYLKKFIGVNDLRGNYFLSTPDSDVAEAETTLRIPEQLKYFYKEIGTGILSCKINDLDTDTSALINEILPPMVVAHFYQGIIEHQTEPKVEALEYDDHWLALSTLEMLQPGDLPFFEIGDSSSFMVMKLHSDNPNAVWSDCGVKIEDSFERFIYRLYYESPSFYGPIIEDYYADK